jgi:hypothetical protein
VLEKRYRGDRGLCPLESLNLVKSANYEQVDLHLPMEDVFVLNFVVLIEFFEFFLI